MSSSGSLIACRRGAGRRLAQQVRHLTAWLLQRATAAPKSMQRTRTESNRRGSRIIPIGWMATLRRPRHRLHVKPHGQRDLHQPRQRDRMNLTNNPGNDGGPVGPRRDVMMCFTQARPEL